VQTVVPLVALVRSQILFSIALGAAALLITFFAGYVVWSTMSSSHPTPAASSPVPWRTSRPSASSVRRRSTA
jgi:predicted phage tail protein